MELQSTEDFMLPTNIPPFPSVAQCNTRVKMYFMRRVLGILAIQCIASSLASSVLMLTPITRFYISENVWLLTLACFLIVVLWVCMMRKRSNVCLNNFLVCFYTAVASYVLAVYVTYFDLLSVLQALILITGNIMCLFFYSLQSRWDYNIWPVLCFSLIFIICMSESLQIIIAESILHYNHLQKVDLYLLDRGEWGIDLSTATKPVEEPCTDEKPDARPHVIITDPP